MTTRSFLVAVVFLVVGRHLGAVATSAAPQCFPYGSATLPTDGSAPNVSRADWWCPQSLAYGFQGFSYPLEVGDCADPSNSFAAMSADFARMKADFGATIVRLYYPVCAEASVFENALKAGVANNMAVIPQVWFNFGDGDVWKQSQQAIFDVMEGRYKAVAPYVFHSADFGTEPVGDGVDGGGQQFVKDLGAFKARMNAYGVPAGISEDWDRPGTLSGGDGTGLSAYGKQVAADSDHVHSHIMPFYHGNINENETWAYIRGQLQYYNSSLPGKPMMITETQWAWGPTPHYPSHVDLGVPQYTAYWKAFDAACETFKAFNVGWFLHAWRGEDTFDLVKADGAYVVPNWKPRAC